MPLALLVQPPSTCEAMLTSGLVQAGFEVELESKPRQALDRIQQGDVDCVVTALIMELVDGIEVINLTRTLFPDTLILALDNSGKPDFNYPVIARKVGADDTIAVKDVPGEFNRVLRAAMAAQLEN